MDGRLLPIDADPRYLHRDRVPHPGQDPIALPTGRLSLVDRATLARPTLEAGRALLGARLVRDDETGRRAGRIVEVEAYIGRDDQASHARFGETARNRVMFGLPGGAYVYLVYGMYDCLNVVTEPEGWPAALLIRAVEPLEGIERMRLDRIALAGSRHRAHAPRRMVAEANRIGRLSTNRLASGPGLVAAAFGLDTRWTGTDLCDAASPLRLEAGPAAEPAAILASPRIGIEGAGLPWTALPWRLSLIGHPSVSGPTGAR